MSVSSAEIWSAKAVTGNAQVPPYLVQQGGLIVHIVTSGFSGTLQFNAAAHANAVASLFVLPHIPLGTVPLANSVTAISWTTSNATEAYLVPLLGCQFVQLTMTRSAGTISLWVSGPAYYSGL